MNKILLKIYTSDQSSTSCYANTSLLAFKDTLFTSVSKIPLLTPILIQLNKLAKIDIPFCNFSDEFQLFVNRKTQKRLLQIPPSTHTHTHTQKTTNLAEKVK
jgi:hypothetical protein